MGQGPQEVRHPLGGPPRDPMHRPLAALFVRVTETELAPVAVGPEMAGWSAPRPCSPKLHLKVQPQHMRLHQRYRRWSVDTLARIPI